MARRSGLGKGLSALIPTEATGETDSLLRVVPISHIRPNPLQPRSHFDEEAMASLAASIKEVGVLQPVLVRELRRRGGELRADRRGAAVAGGPPGRPADHPRPGPGRPTTSPASSRHWWRTSTGTTSTPWRRRPPTSSSSTSSGCTHEQVATRVGKGRATVTNTLRLLQLPAGVQRALAERDHLGRPRPGAAGHAGPGSPGEARSSGSWPRG